MKYFGTDGIRGQVGIYPITPDFMLKLGYALGIVLQEQFSTPSIVIGKDTRISGYLFESALESGLTYAGVNVYLVGPISTPAVSYLTRAFRMSAGCVISASHNPYYDNGIKIFTYGGNKIDASFEKRIEELIDQKMTIAHSLGYVYRINDAKGRYIEFCKSTVSHSLNLQGLTIAVDCANGATYETAPLVFEELGAEVIATNVNPDGININDNCGATNVTNLINTTLSNKVDYGIAFDGDGDRVVIIDKVGRIYDGDKILYILVKLYQKLDVNIKAVVGTILTNSGLESALSKLGVNLLRTDVGDKNIIEQISKHNLLLGGEPSGHIIIADKHNTGDGIIASLQVLYATMLLNKELYQIVDWDNIQQVTYNIPINNNKDWQYRLQDIIDESNFTDEGRMIVRLSGTEPVLRIMIESNDDDFVQRCLSNIKLALNIC